MIRREAKMCNYTIGDRVVPNAPEDEKKYGIGKVVHLITCYKDWPAHLPFPTAPERPHIVTVECEQDQAMYTCTSTYITKLKEAQ